MANNTPDLFAQQGNSKKTRHVYSVSEITRDIKLVLENTFGEVWVEGEVSGVSKISTGTLFFNLKDSLSLLKCVMFNSYVSGVKFEIKDGLSLICFGRVGVYEKEGKYQLYVQALEPKGVGSLQLALEQLKERLEKEGLFSPAHKKPIPYLPSRIGVVTSISGAAIKDILKVLETRFKDVHIVVNPVRVQGEGAKEEISEAIKDFNLLNQEQPADKQVEVMIVGRGGGSIEDLWAFNEEVVARAIYNSRIPVISAIGHERDWTIADLVADFRAPTPSAAAEKVIPRKDDLREKVEDLMRDLKRSLSDTIITFEESIDELKHRLSISNPLALLCQYKDRISDLAKQAGVRINHFIRLRESEFIKSAQKLSSLNPLNILSRGFSVTFKFPGLEIIKEARAVKAGDIIKTRLYKGELVSEVREVKKDGRD